MGLNWTFEETHPMGGATGQAFNNTLQGTRPPEDLLAREVIQNSCDAALGPSSQVKVVFRMLKIGWPDKKTFLDELHVVEAFRPRLTSIGLQAENCLTQVSNKGVPLHLLYVKDYDTYGIYGPPHSPESHFQRLLLALGDDSKAFGATNTGGSYGYGKSVYTFNSNIHTIVAYSVFEDQGDGVTARLMGCSFFDRHTYDGTEYTGRAWFGKLKKEGSGIVFPFENAEAHELATKFLFKTRDSSQTGTTILIVDSTVDMDALRCYVEDSWWPRLIENDLSVAFYENEILLKHPRPKLREELRPFIECYEMAVDRSKPTGNHQKSKKLSAYKDKQLGFYGFQLIDADKAGQEEFQRFVSTVALIRSPRMVVNYAQFGRATPPAVGVFVASTDIDNYLKLSEPPAHDEWDPTHARLKRVGDIGQGTVKHLLDRLKANFRQFQSEAMPPQPTEGKRLKLLERILGDVFHPTLGKTPPPPHETDPVSIHFLNKTPLVELDGNGLVTKASFAISLKEEFVEETADVNLLVKVPILEGDDEGEGDPLSITLTTDGHKVEAVEEANLPIQLVKGTPMRFDLVTVPYNPLWSTRVIVKVVKSAEA